MGIWKRLAALEQGLEKVRVNQSEISRGHANKTERLSMDLRTEIRKLKQAHDRIQKVLDEIEMCNWCNKLVASELRQVKIAGRTFRVCNARCEGALRHRMQKQIKQAREQELRQ